jgi:nicotinamide-nucleotide amidase
MIAEIVSIGDELTSGQRLDTNSQWLSQRLGDMGIRTVYHTTVADDLEANIRIFREAADRADLVISTGGLGPTADDLTRQAVAAAFGKHLVFDQESYDGILALFQKRGREMPESNRVQAEFPAEASIVPNPQGSAPGFWLSIDRGDRPPSELISLPGVPAEMHEMFFQTLEPEILKRLGPQRKIIAHKTIHCFGAGESDIEQKLPDLVRRGRQPTVGITASKATITLRITAEGSNLESCHQKMAGTIQTIYECLGDLIFGEDGVTLEDVVIQSLRERNESLAIADAVTGGVLGQWLSEADPSGLLFLGGTFLRRLTQMDQVLPVNHGPVDATQWSLGMAQRARLQWEANWGLAMLFIESSDDQLPQIEIAVTNGEHASTQRFTFAAHSAIQFPRAGKQALNFLRLQMGATGPRPPSPEDCVRRPL